MVALSRSDLLARRAATIRRGVVVHRPWRNAAIAIGAYGLSALCIGCTGTTGHLAVASTRAIDTADLRSDRPVTHVIGYSCINVVVIYPTAMPKVDAAIAAALREANANVLTNVVIRYEIRYFPFVYGIACYVAEGDAQ